MVQPKLNQMMSDFIIPYIKEPRMILVPLTYTWNVIPHIIPRDKNDSCPSNLYIECYTIHSSSGRNGFSSGFPSGCALGKSLGKPIPALT